METITKNNFDEKIATGIVVVDFSATWCGPCKTMLPILEDLNNTNDNFIIHKIDVDSDREVAAKFGIKSIPTMLFFKDGQLITKKMGVISKVDFLNTISTL
jgi:thioredoxin 1